MTEPKGSVGYHQVYLHMHHGFPEDSNNPEKLCTLQPYVSATLVGEVKIVTPQCREKKLVRKGEVMRVSVLRGSHWT